MTNKEFLESVTLDGEEWRDVIGFEGYYMVSSLGRCVSLNRVYEDNNRSSKYIKQRLVSFTMVANNYLQYRLWKNNKQYNVSAHRLVASAFIPNPNNYPEIDHIDTNKTNNSVSNLRWCTRTMNGLNPISRKKNSDSKKGKPNFQLSKAVVRVNPNNPNDVKFYNSASETKRLDGYNPGHVCEVCRGNGHRNMHRGYFWMWLSDYEASNQQVKELLNE